MTNTLRYGKATYSYEAFDPDEPCSPGPVMTLKKVFTQGRFWNPRPGDRTILLLLRRKMPKEVSFTRAYCGWRASGAREEFELGEGRAFLRWIQKHELGIAWENSDLKLHPYFTCSEAPRHDPEDETAHGLSFAIAPIQVNGRKVKLYVPDIDVLRLISLSYGEEEDFMQLVRRYVEQRHQWQAWQAPAPTFIEWVLSQGRRALFSRGQLGFQLPLQINR